MARTRKSAKRDLQSYVHDDKDRVNNPPAGLVTPATDKDMYQKRNVRDARD